MQQLCAPPAKGKKSSQKKCVMPKAAELQLQLQQHRQLPQFVDLVGHHWLM
jgi:hypothetical protein